MIVWIAWRVTVAGHVLDVVWNGFYDYPRFLHATFDGAYVAAIDTDWELSAFVDADADWYESGVDCDDADPSAYPGRSDTPYDGVDNDCAGDGDEVDVDNDGYVASEVGGDDCDDDQSTTHPGATELAYNGRDDDCADGDLVDQDGDGFDSTQVDGDDCDDTDATVHPGAFDVAGDGIDQDCNGYDPPGVAGPIWGEGPLVRSPPRAPPSVSPADPAPAPRPFEVPGGCGGSTALILLGGWAPTAGRRRGGRPANTRSRLEEA